MFARQLNRVMPELPVTAMRTFAIVAPTTTHFRPATCQEVDCPAFQYGWTLATAGQPAVLVHAAKNSGRAFIAVRDETTGAEQLIFESGQPCFKASTHRVRVDRPEIFLSRNGDWRGNPDGAGAKPLIHSSADAWADEMQTTLERCTNG